MQINKKTNQVEIIESVVKKQVDLNLIKIRDLAKFNQLQIIKPYSFLTKVKKTESLRLLIRISKFLKINGPLRYLYLKTFIYLANISIALKILKKSKNIYKVQKLSRYKKINTKDVVELMSPFNGTYCDPIFISKKSKNISKANKETYKFSKIKLFNFNKSFSTVIGGSNWVLMEDKTALIHDLSDISRDCFSEELHERLYISRALNRCYVPDYGNEVEPTPMLLETAAVFLDACAFNYAHWLTEVLPRLFIFCQNKEYADVPILIDEGLHANILETIKFIINPEQPIYCVPRGYRIKIKNLLTVSCAGYVPFGYTKNSYKNCFSGSFHGKLLTQIREYYIGVLKKKTSSNIGKKIYIQRNSTNKIASNLEEVKQLLLSEGFITVSPELLTFTEQVRVFSEADIIVGSSGAAWANIIFSKPLTQLIILIGDSKHVSYGYWQRLACATGNSVDYVLGTVPSYDKASQHPNFNVPIEVLEKTISRKRVNE